MKLWEVLKLENKGKKYKDNNGSIYELNITKHNEPILYRYNDIVTFTQYEVMHLDFAEVKPLSGWERVGEGKLYYYLDHDTKVETDSDDYGKFEDTHYQYYNYFSTKEKAEEVRKEQELYRRMKKFYDENDGNIEWQKGSDKYHIAFDYDDKKYIIYNSGYWHKRLGVVYFSTRELAQRCIDEVIKPFYARK